MLVHGEICLRQDRRGEFGRMIGICFTCLQLDKKAIGIYRTSNGKSSSGLIGNFINHRDLRHTENEYDVH